MPTVPAVDRVSPPLSLLSLAEIPTGDIKLYVGIAFAAAVLILLTFIFFKTPVLTDDQRKLLRIFCALLAGCAGVFISGEALFNLSREAGSTKMAVQGTAGFALFFCVWFTFDPLRRKSGARGFAISFVEDMTFKRATEILGSELSLGVNLDALRPEERDAKIRGVHVEGRDAQDVLAKLNEFVKQPERVRAFSLERQGVVLKIVPTA